MVKSSWLFESSLPAGASPSVRPLRPSRRAPGDGPGRELIVATGRKGFKKSLGTRVGGAQNKSLTSPTARALSGHAVTHPAPLMTRLESVPSARSLVPSGAAQPGELRGRFRVTSTFRENDFPGALGFGAVPALLGQGGQVGAGSLFRG